MAIAFLSFCSHSGFLESVIPLSFPLPWPCSGGMFWVNATGVGGWDTGMSLEKVGSNRTLWSLGDGVRENRESVAGFLLIQRWHEAVEGAIFFI